MDSRIKILHVITTTIGGAGEHVLLLCKGLDRDKFDVSVAYGPGMPLDAEFERAGLRIVEIPMSRGGGIGGSLKSFAALRNLMRRERFDIVQTHTSEAGLLGRLAAWTMRIPLVIHMVHAYAGHDHVPNPKRWVFTTLEKTLDKLTHYYIAGSEAIKDKGIRKGIIKPSRIDRIYYSMDIDRFDASLLADKSAARSFFGLPQDRQIVGFVGRLEPQKGVEYFLGAAQLILQSKPETLFWMVGDGPQRGLCEQLAKQYGIADNVIIQGWTQEIPIAMQAIDLLMVPSRWEAFGIVNLEAMAACRPIVASAVEGIPEVVEHGITGRLVDCGDVSALSSEVVTLLENTELAERMGEAGRKVVETKFSPKSMVNQHETLYERLLRRGP